MTKWTVAALGFVVAVVVVNIVLSMHRVPAARMDYVPPGLMGVHAP